MKPLRLAASITVMTDWWLLLASALDISLDGLLNTSLYVFHRIQFSRQSEPLHDRGLHIGPQALG